MKTQSELEAWDRGFAAAINSAACHLREAEARAERADHWLRSARRQLRWAAIALACAMAGVWVLVVAVLTRR